MGISAGRAEFEVHDGLHEGSMRPTLFSILTERTPFPQVAICEKWPSGTGRIRKNNTMTRHLLALAVAILAYPIASAQSEKPLTRIAFGSCADQDKPCPIWGSIGKLQPELLVLLGDTMYADLDKSKKVDPNRIRETYGKLDGEGEFAKLKKAVPILATWDDHDFGKNDGDARFAFKDESQQIFLDFFGVPKDSPRRARKGVYHSQVFGPEGKRVQVILLDGRRKHRSRNHRRAGQGRQRIFPAPTIFCAALGIFSHTQDTACPRGLLDRRRDSCN